jgi:hypothetical protein
MGWNCAKCRESTSSINKHEGDTRWLCNNCYKNEYMRVNLSEEELKAVEIIECEILNGAKIRDTYKVVSKKMNISISQCNSRYYAKWRFALSKEVKDILTSRKSDKQKENCYYTLS